MGGGFIQGDIDIVKRKSRLNSQSHNENSFIGEMAALRFIGKFGCQFARGGLSGYKRPRPVVEMAGILVCENVPRLNKCCE